jgi:putative tryptophan/tyrosine transport system substrate-binding protein
MRLRAIPLIVALAILVAPLAPLATEAQQPTHMHRIGVLVGATPDPRRAPAFEAFLGEMRALGYVEGQNFVMEYRWAEGQFERFPDLVAELVRLKVDVLITNGVSLLQTNK